jgi:hypothetical protein
MSNISIFSDYSQKENRVTNYCLLVLKLLYEENPKYLNEILATLCGEEFSNQVGVTFKQQERKKSSVPDGLILQKAFSIFIEVKKNDWFTNRQLEAHLEALNKEKEGKKILIALSNFEVNDIKRFEILEKARAEKYPNILFSAVGFEEFVSALSIENLPKNIQDFVAEFKDYLSEQNLLPRWRHILDVINCAGIPRDVLEGGVYMCPASNGAYSHRRSRYFGMYKNKRVSIVSEIEAIFDVDIHSDDLDSKAKMKWINVEPHDKKILQQRAISTVEKYRPKAGVVRVFLLGTLYDTNLKWDARQMQGSKIYFDIEHLDVSSAEELANKLATKVRSDFK